MKRQTFILEINPHLVGTNNHMYDFYRTSYRNPKTILKKLPDMLREAKQYGYLYRHFFIDGATYAIRYKPIGTEIEGYTNGQIVYQGMLKEFENN